MLVALLAAAAASAAEVELTDKVRQNFGIATTTVTAMQAARVWQASAQVLDGSSLVSSLSDLRAAQSAAAASTSELKRLEELFKADNNVALKTVEAARAQAVSDASHVQTVRAQLLGAWGTAITRMSDADSQQLAQALLAGRVALIRAELANATVTTLTAQNVRLKFSSDIAPASVTAKLLGAMPQRAEQAIGSAYLLSATINNGLDLQPGQILSVELQDAARSVSGVKLPRAAVVRWQGRQWAYVEHEAGHYQRVAVSIAQWLDDAALVSAGVKAGDKVVTVGAGLLLGAENAPAEEAPDAPSAADKKE